MRTTGDRRMHALRIPVDVRTVQTAIHMVAQNLPTSFGRRGFFNPRRLKDSLFVKAVSTYVWWRLLAAMYAQASPHTASDIKKEGVWGTVDLHDNRSSSSGIHSAGSAMLQQMQVSCHGCGGGGGGIGERGGESTP